jgi:DNA-binding response OmpR family regulator
MKILIIEDDFTIRTQLAQLLEAYGYESLSLERFENAVADALAAGPDLILLDLGLVGSDGYRICRELREHSAVPIIVVTSRDTETDELMSMRVGADDFITKPYRTPILLARIETLLRRAYGSGGELVTQIGGVALNLGNSTLTYAGQSVELTKNELRILHELMKQRGVIISRDKLMEALWQSDEFVDDNTLTVNINRLRRKLEEIGLADYIITKRGQGYMI